MVMEEPLPAGEMMQLLHQGIASEVFASCCIESAHLVRCIDFWMEVEGSQEEPRFRLCCAMPAYQDRCGTMPQT
jgi:hypothetical protein